MDLRLYLDLARRWWWLVLLCALLAGTAAFAVSRQQTRIYQAQSLVLLDTSKASSDLPAYGDLVTSERLGRTYATLFSSSETVNEAVERLGRRPAYLTISAEPQRDTSLLRLVIESDDREAAVFLANTLPVVLAEQQLARQNSRYVEAQSNLSAQMEEVGTEIARLNSEIDRLTRRGADEESNELSQLNSDLSLQQATYDTILRTLATLQLNETNSREVLSVVEPAVMPTLPVRPRPLSNLMTALILGALIGAGIVYLIEYLDDTVKSDSALETMTGSGPLAKVGRLARHGKRIRIDDIDPKDPASEAYRILRTNIRFASVDRPLRRLMVTSPSPGDGKSTTAANLALVMAQADLDTILVDADLRRPVQHTIFNRTNEVGLTSALLEANEGATVERFLMPVKDQPKLRLLPTGPLPPNPSELLSSKRMHALLEKLETMADVVIVDTPPVLVVSDSSVLAREMSGVLLVLRANHTTFKATESALAQLQSVQAPLLGTVINDVPLHHRGYYYYGYHYSKPTDGDGPTGGDGGRRRRVRLPRVSTERIWQRIQSRQ